MLCKHLVREADDLLNYQLHRELAFFANMKWQHYPSYYSIKGIHFEADKEEISVPETEIWVLGHELQLGHHSRNPTLAEHVQKIMHLQLPKLTKKLIQM